MGARTARRPLVAGLGCRRRRRAAPELPAVVQAGPPGSGQIALVTHGGHALVISDVPGPASGITLRTQAGARISLSDTSIVINNGQGAAVTLNGNSVHFTGVVI